MRLHCPNGCSFDVPKALAERAMRLHQRTRHPKPVYQCSHEWEKGEVFQQWWGWADNAREDRCVKCGKRKLVILG